MKSELEFASIPSGNYKMGTDDQIGFPEDQEGPALSVYVPKFKISTTTVTVKEFSEFVKDTEYETVAEKIGWSFVFVDLLSNTTKQKSKKMKETPWWYVVQGADWKHPEGPDSNVDGRLDNPVTQVSLSDAIAYCIWSGTRLPSESEWEKAARGNSKGKKYPWGNNLVDEDSNENIYHANTWQGDFPRSNSLADGYLGTAPVKTYKPNDFGLYQVIGNVWEWCANDYGYSLDIFNKITPEDFWIETLNTTDKRKVAIRGGSFLCHNCFCNRFRVAARNGEMSDTASSNLSFRIVDSSEENL